MKRTIVILGMHGSGTSMVSGILHAIGVNMNPNPDGKVRHYKTNEDASFFRLNVRILSSCNGQWLQPPTREQIQGTGFEAQIKRLIEARNENDLWGFKDPRTCITVPLYHEHLRNPHYIRVVRGHDEVAESIIRRGGVDDPRRWIGLSEEYCRQANAFLGSVESPMLVVQSHLLFDKGPTAEKEIERIAKFVGISSTSEMMKDALSTITTK